VLTVLVVAGHFSIFDNGHFGMCMSSFYFVRYLCTCWSKKVERDRRLLFVIHASRLDSLVSGCVSDGKMLC